MKLIEIIIYIGIFQGLLLIAALLRIKNRSKTVNNYLILFLTAIVILLVSRLRYLLDLTPDLRRWFHLLDGVLFIYCLLLFAYLKQVTQKTKFNLNKAHFIPLALHLAVSLYLIGIPIDQYSRFVDQGQFHWYFATSEAFIIAINLSYLLLSFAHLKKYRQKENQLLSFEQTIIRYLNFYLTSIFICMICWAIVFLNNIFFQFNLSIINYGLVWTGITASTYVIGYYSLLYPAIFQLDEGRISNKNSIRRLSPLEIDRIKTRIDELMTNEKVYLDSQLTLKEFSKKIEASDNDVSWVLNHEINRSFYDFINHYRIMEFLQKIKKNEHKVHTILGLSMDVGFNSKSTFNKAFKQEMNDTPSNYIKSRHS